MPAKTAQAGLNYKRLHENAAAFLCAFRLQFRLRSESSLC